MLSLYKKLMLLVLLIAATGSFQICSGESNTTIEGSIASPIYNLSDTYQVVADDYKHLSLLNGAIAWETGYIEKLLTVDVERDEQDPTKIIKGSAAAHLCNYLFTCYPSPAQGFPSVIGIRKLFNGDDQTINDTAAKFIADCVVNTLFYIYASSRIKEIGHKLREESISNDQNNKLLWEQGELENNLRALFQEPYIALSQEPYIVLSQPPHIAQLSNCPPASGKQEQMLELMTSPLNKFIDEIAEESSSENSTLMPHTAEMILLAFIYRALGHHKGYIKYFYEALNKKLEYKFLLHPRARSVFTHYPHLVYENVVSLMSWKGLVSMSRLPKDWEYERYKSVTPKVAKQKIEDLLSQAPKNDYQRLAQGLSSLIYDQKGKDCSLFAEDLVFYASQLSYIPKPLGPAWATYEMESKHHIGKDPTTNANTDTAKKTFSFFDTTGTAIRNFIRFISYDYTQQEFSWKKLKKQIPDINPSDGLIKYLKNYGPRDDDTPEAYNEWAKLMVNKDYIFYQHVFVLKNQNTFFSWKPAFSEGTLGIQVVDDEKKVKVQKLYKEDYKIKNKLDVHLPTTVNDNLPYSNVTLVPMVSNIIFMLACLLGTQGKISSVLLPKKPGNDLQEAESVAPGSNVYAQCTWWLSTLKKPEEVLSDSKYDFSEIQDPPASMMLHGTYIRTMKHYLLAGAKKVTFNFNFVTTPHYGTFGIEDFNIFSQHPNIDHDDVDYEKTPELSLLITSLKLISVRNGTQEEENLLNGLPERLQAANQLLLPLVVVKKVTQGSAEAFRVVPLSEEQVAIPLPVTSKAEEVERKASEEIFSEEEEKPAESTGTPQAQQLTKVNESLEQENREQVEENTPKGEGKEEPVSTGMIPQETPSGSGASTPSIKQLEMPKNEYEERFKPILPENSWLLTPSNEEEFTRGIFNKPIEEEPVAQANKQELNLPVLTEVPAEFTFAGNPLPTPPEQFTFLQQKMVKSQQKNAENKPKKRNKKKSPSSTTATAAAEELLQKLRTEDVTQQLLALYNSEKNQEIVDGALNMLSESGQYAVGLLYNIYKSYADKSCREKIVDGALNMFNSKKWHARTLLTLIYTSDEGTNDRAAIVQGALDRLILYDDACANLCDLLLHILQSDVEKALYAPIIVEGVIEKYKDRNTKNEYKSKLKALLIKINTIDELKLSLKKKITEALEPVSEEKEEPVSTPI